jgi:hypothetical protein
MTDNRIGNPNRRLVGQIWGGIVGIGLILCWTWLRTDHIDHTLSVLIGFFAAGVTFRLRQWLKLGSETERRAKKVYAGKIAAGFLAGGLAILSFGFAFHVWARGGRQVHARMRCC